MFCLGYVDKPTILMDISIEEPKKTNVDLAELKETFSSYSGNPNYVFGSTSDSYIVFEKTPFTETNESRKLKKGGDENYATYCANELKVIGIYNRYNLSETKEITRGTFFDRPGFIYELGKIIKDTHYGIEHKHMVKGKMRRIIYPSLSYVKTVEAMFYKQMVLKYFNGTYFCRNYDGGLEFKYDYKDGKTNGVHEQYCDGNIQYRINYVNGVKEGESIKFFENGKIKSIYNYSNGKLNGLCQSWYKNGNWKKKSNYLDDVLHGCRETFYKNRRREERCYYNKGKRNGIYENWCENGECKKKYSYENGKLIQIL